MHKKSRVINGPMDLMRAPTDPTLFLLHSYGVSVNDDIDPDVVRDAVEALKDGSLPRPEKSGASWPELVAWLEKYKTADYESSGPKP
jgi:hypothetical protein